MLKSPDEDELTTAELEKIDFFLEERRKELVKDAVAKHARERKKKEAASEEEQEDAPLLKKNNEKKDINSNKKNSGNDAGNDAGSSGFSGNGSKESESYGNNKKNGIDSNLSLIHI